MKELLQSLVDSSPIGMAIAKDDKILYKNFLFDALSRDTQGIKKTEVTSGEYVFLYLDVDYEAKIEDIHNTNRNRLAYFLDISQTLLDSLDKANAKEAYDIVLHLQTLTKSVVNEAGFDVLSNVNVEELILNTIKKCTARSNKYDVCFTYDFNVEDPNIDVDGGRLEAIVQLLINNTIFYSKSGDRVIIGLHKDKINGHDYFKLVLENNNKDLDFDLLCRGLSKPIVKLEGLSASLQLSFNIVENFIEAMNGTFEYKKGDDGGIRLTLSFPVLEHCDYQNDDGKIMVVDDNEMNLDLLTTILTDEGYSVYSADSAKKAILELENSDRFEYKVVLMDILMPEMDGYEATEEIRRSTREDLRNIPIIAITANAFDEDKARAISAGMNGHMSKPIKLDEVLELVSRYV